MVSSAKMSISSQDVHPATSSDFLDDDGQRKRTGTVWTASAHIITAVIGSGVLSLAWALAQLGWIAGPATMLLFAVVTYYTSILLAACYRTGDPVNGKRNYTYMGAVRSILGGVDAKLVGVVQYVNLFGTAIGYTIAAAISSLAVQRSSCYHKSGGKDPSCHFSANPYMIGFGVAQIIFSQIPDFEQLSWLSIVAAIMSFTYSTIGLGLGIAKVVENGKIAGTLTGVTVGTITTKQKVWKTFQALGNIAFAYSYSMILIEIQDTVKSPPSEEKTMRKATALSVASTTLFYMACGCVGYAAFGDSSPGNLLTEVALFNPYWVLDIANVAVVIHLLGAYQVYSQPLFAFVEKQAANRFPNSKFITQEFKIKIFPGSRPFHLNMFRLVWRTAFVIVTTVLSMLMPFFNDIVGLLGAIGFWPLTVYVPVAMYIKQMEIPKWSTKWVCFHALSFACFVVTIVSAVGSIVGIADDLKTYKPFEATF